MPVFNHSVIYCLPVSLIRFDLVSYPLVCGLVVLLLLAIDSSESDFERRSLLDSLSSSETCRCGRFLELRRPALTATGFSRFRFFLFFAVLWSVTRTRAQPLFMYWVASQDELNAHL